VDTKLTKPAMAWQCRPGTALAL